MSTESVNILLRPRPYARCGGTLLLLPLLSHKPPLKPLPVEIWHDILEYAMAGVDANNAPRVSVSGRLSFLTINKALKDVALPLLYRNVRIGRLSTFEKFVAHLRLSDQNWDSIRRIPYSTPGRWIQTLDIDVPLNSPSERCRLDSLFIQFFPLVPFLRGLSLISYVVLSRRAMEALTFRDGASNLRILEGMRYERGIANSMEADPLVQLLGQCIHLEELSITGPGLDGSETEWPPYNEAVPQGESDLPLDLRHLHTLTLLSMHSAPVMQALLGTPLPSLRKLTISPYDDIPYPVSLASAFIRAHGATLRSLMFLTHKSWPTRRHPSPTDILETCPELRHLSLETPLPMLTAAQTAPYVHHPLEILSIPRPTADAWMMLQTLLPRLPSLRAVRAREVHWLRHGTTKAGLETGVQGEMRNWRRRLDRRGVKVLDAAWKESP